MKRRDFIRCVAGVSTMGLSSHASALANDKSLWLYCPATQENIVANYYKNGQLLDVGLLDIYRLMRDWRTRHKHVISTDVINVLHAVMTDLHVEQPVVVHSGYRTPTTNRKISGSAPNSLHMKGRAVDFSVPGVDPEDLYALTRHHSTGGVGLYKTNGFVHLDDGGYRSW